MLQQILKQGWRQEELNRESCATLSSANVTINTMQYSYTGSQGSCFMLCDSLHSCTVQISVSTRSLAAINVFQSMTILGDIYDMLLSQDMLLS